MAMLEVENVHAYYGKIHALKDISLNIDKGEIVTLIGANGAGKSTTLKTMSGLLRPRQGSVRLEGEDLTALRAHVIVTRGMIQVPEGRRIFGQLTVMENLENFPPEEEVKAIKLKVAGALKTANEQKAYFLEEILKLVP